MYRLDFGEDFWKTYKKLVQGNPILLKKFEKTLDILLQDPFYPSLKTHKVDTKRNKNIYSSSVSGDVRIGWMFNQNDDLVILILEAGTHSGASQIYK